MRVHLITKSMRDRRRGILGWCSGIAALIVVQMSVYPTIRDARSGWDSAVETFPEVFREMFRITDYTSEAGYLSTELMSFMIPFIFLGLGASWGARLTTEDEEGGTAEIVMALPITRWQYFSSRVAAAVSVVLIAASVFVVAMVIGARLLGMSIGISKFIHAGIVAAESSALSLSLAAVVGSLSGRRGVALGTAMGVGVAAFVAYSLAPLVEFFESIRAVNPWHWTIGRDPLLDAFDASAVALNVAVCLVLLGASGAIFSRRDISH